MQCVWLNFQFTFVDCPTVNLAVKVLMQTSLKIKFLINRIAYTNSYVHPVNIISTY